MGASAVNADLANLKLVNYYPAANAWGNMWTRWDPATLDADFARISQLGGNAVRLIVLPDVFGFPHPSPTMLSRLDQAVGFAASHGLRVQLTLFDGWSDWTDVTGSKDSGNVRELVHMIERAVILAESEVLRPNDFLLSPAKELTVAEGPDTLEEMELLMIRRTLNQHDGNYSSAAVQLGISRQTLYNKMKKNQL